MHLLKSKIALITGASSGIGKAMALELAHREVDLVLIARREDKLKEVKADILKSHPNVRVNLITCDVNDSKLYEVLERDWASKIDILINNAGLALGRDKFQDSNFSDVELVVNTNVLASFKMVRTILPHMLSRRTGDIINLCSIAGHVTYQGAAVYCASKHAVSAFTKTVREETAGQNVRVMQISPGMVDTEFSTVRFHGDEDKARAVYANMNPLTPQDIARQMLFMLEQPRHVTIDEVITLATDQGSPTHVVRRPV